MRRWRPLCFFLWLSFELHSIEQGYPNHCASKNTKLCRKVSCFWEKAYEMFGPRWIALYKFDPKVIVLLRCSCKGCQIGLFWPNIRYLDSFQVCLPKKFQLAFFWLHLKLVGLKKVVWPFDCFLTFCRWNRFLWRKILLFQFFRQHICPIFVINATLGRRPTFRFSNTLHRPNQWKCVHSLHSVLCCTN